MNSRYYGYDFVSVAYNKININNMGEEYKMSKSVPVLRTGRVVG